MLYCSSSLSGYILSVIFVCVAGCRVNSTSSSNSLYNVNSSQSLSSYNLSPLPAGPAAGAGAISMAAAQAVQATAQVKPPSSLFPFNSRAICSPLLPSLPFSTIFGLLGVFFVLFFPFLLFLYQIMLSWH